MKKSKFLLIALFATLLVACSDEKKDEPKPDPENPENPQTPQDPQTPDEPETPDEPGVTANPDAPTISLGVFALNQGNYYYQIEGSLDYIAYDSDKSQLQIFQKANGRSLGATPQGGVTYGDKIYIGMYESNLIEVIDRNTYKSIKSLPLADSEGQSPRSLIAKDGKVYVSMYNGYVTCLDTLSLEIEKNVKVGPNPEIMAIKGNKLYVPNSDGMNWEAGFGTTASVIDLEKFEVEKTITVGLNPTKFVSNGTDLFVLCMGDYFATPAMIYQVGDNDVCEQIAEATMMSIKGNKVYYINAPYGSAKIDYICYDIAKKEHGKMIDDEGVDFPASVEVDPINGNIVISSYVLNNGYADYNSDGYAKVYDREGKSQARYDVGVSPVCLFFNYK